MPSNSTTTAAIVVAAGSSCRMGFDKLDADLAGKTVLQRSLEAFESCRGITEIILVTVPGRENERRTQAAAWNLSKLTQVVGGGVERHLSVWSGLQETDDTIDLIAVHDGGRPLVSPEQIRRCIDEAARSGAAASARRITETLKRANEEGIVIGPIDRENLWAMETPQVFRRDLLIRAYRNLIDNGLAVTDEVSALELLGGHPVTLVENAEPNLKITFPSDLGFAARLLLSSNSTSGQSAD